MAIATAASTATETHQFDTVDVEIREVLQNRVSEDMHNAYDNGNIKLLVYFLTTNHEHYGAPLKPNLLEELKTQNELDKEQMTARGCLFKLRGHIRAIGKKWLRRRESGRPKLLTYPQY